MYCGDKLMEVVQHPKKNLDYLYIFISFAKEPYKRDYILQKRPIISRSQRNTCLSVASRKYVM